MSGKNYLIDTNIVIGLFASEPSIIERIKSQSGVISVPSIVIGELFSKDLDCMFLLTDFLLPKIQLLVNFNLIKAWVLLALAQVITCAASSYRD